MTDPAKPRMRDGLIKRGDWWYFVLDERRDPATGKRRQKWVKGGRSRDEAKRARNAARTKHDQGGWRAPGALTVQPYIEDRWLATMANKVAPSTLVSYRQNLAKVTARVGHVRLADLDAPTLEGLYADLEAGGLARSTVRLIHNQLHRALADAVRWSLLSHNPAALVRPPKPPGRPPSVWTAAQLGTFLTAVADERLAALYRLAAATGMRLGEVCGLRWPDIDLTGGYLTVPKAKTAAGRRRVELDPGTVAALREHRKGQAAERLAFGAGYTDHGLVFARPGWGAAEP
jgi:integrase